MVECYVDDIAGKSHSESNHLDDLRTVFGIMMAHQLKMNSTKSFLEVLSGKFIEFILTSRGIHLDPDKLKVIQGMQPLKILKKLKRSTKKTCLYLKNHHNLLGHCQPFTRLMRKDVSFVWDEPCQKAFEDIKEYLTKPPVLVAPILGKLFLLFCKLWTTS